MGGKPTIQRWVVDVRSLESAPEGLTVRVRGIPFMRHSENAWVRSSYGHRKSFGTIYYPDAYLRRLGQVTYRGEPIQ